MGAGLKGFPTSVSWRDGGLLDPDDKEFALFSNSFISAIKKLRELAREMARFGIKETLHEDESIYIQKDREPLGVLLGKSADPESRSSQDWAREIQIQTNPATQISWSKDAILERKVRSKNEDYSSYGRSEGSFSNWVEKIKSRLES
ncbi:hypothetical protein Rs2_29154 [Raphanus sativus]|nr:hypothetical protein Rs2_29154 [Raphanus sativus]